jgi:hypothetical protein
MTSPRPNAMISPNDSIVPFGILAPLKNSGFRLPPLEPRPDDVSSTRMRRPWPIQLVENAGR